MKSIPPALQSALLSPTISLALKIETNTATITESSVLYYQVQETGRLGRADLELHLDNTDDQLTPLIPDLSPTAEITTAEGAYINAAPQYCTRHQWTILSCESTRLTNQPHTLKIIARNHWHRLAQAPTTSTVYNDATLGQLIDALAAQANLIALREPANLWNSRLNWKQPANLPLHLSIGALIGDQNNAHARAYGRFTQSGQWQLMTIAGVEAGLAPAPPAPLTAAIYDATLTHHHTHTRIQLNGLSKSKTIRLPDLEPLYANQTTLTINAHTLRAADIDARLAQEALEQTEQAQTLTIRIQPDLRLELWDRITLENHPYRITRLTTTYNPAHRTQTTPSPFTTHLTLRPLAPTPTTLELP